MTHFTRNLRGRGVPKAAPGALSLAVALALCAVGAAGAQTVVPAAGAAPVRPGVEAIASRRLPGSRVTAKPLNRKGKAYDFHVSAAGWTDTGLDVEAGEVATVEATGEVSLANGHTVTPDGLQRGWKDLLRQFPLNSANAGSLIGRVTDLAAAVPFALGASGKVTMPTTGRLFLAVNAPADLAGTGGFKVKWTFVPPAAPASGAAAAAVAGSAAAGKPAAGAPGGAGVLPLLSPGLLADVPRRVTDAEGHPGDMVNFALLGTKEQVEAAFKAAGWAAVDKTVQDAVLHGLLATLGHEAYVEVPMSTLFLFGRAQDYSFARADPLQVAAKRHHLRLWQTGETLAGRPLWVGSATHDVGFERDQRKENGITHKIDPDIDLERQFLLESFDATGRFRSAAYITPANPLREAKTATGGSFHSDGRVLFMELQ